MNTRPAAEKGRVARSWLLEGIGVACCLTFVGIPVGIVLIWFAERKRGPLSKRRRVILAILSLAVGGQFVFGVAVTASRLREPPPPAALAGFRATPLAADAVPRSGLTVMARVDRGELARVIGTPVRAVPALSGPSVDVKTTGARWYMNWTFIPNPGTDVEFVPLVCGYLGSGGASVGYIQRLGDYLRDHAATYPDGTLWLVGNEIGFQKDSRSPEQYARDFHACHDLLKSINPSWQVSVGPSILSQDRSVTRQFVGGAGAIPYFRSIFASYRQLYGEPMPADWFAATAYVTGQKGTSLHEFKVGIRRFRTFLAAEGFGDRRLVITEFGAPIGGASPKQIAEFMVAASRYMASATDRSVGCPSDGGRLVQRWAWFTAHPLTFSEKRAQMGWAALAANISATSLFDLHGRPTYLWHVFRQLAGASAGVR